MMTLCLPSFADRSGCGFCTKCPNLSIEVLEKSKMQKLTGAEIFIFNEVEHIWVYVIPLTHCGVGSDINLLHTVGPVGPAPAQGVVAQLRVL